jgi:YVTN family beta-propeller protein
VGANEADHTVSRIDTHTDTVTATIPVVHVPVGVAIGADAVWVASRGLPLLSQPALSRIDPGNNTVVETTSLEGTAPLGMTAGAGNLWVASRTPDAGVRIGPVPLPAGSPAANGPLLLMAVLGLGLICLLTAGEVLRRSAHQGRDRPVSDGRLLRALLLRQQASRRADAGECPSEAGRRASSGYQSLMTIARFCALHLGANAPATANRPKFLHCYRNADTSGWSVHHERSPLLDQRAPGQDSRPTDRIALGSTLLGGLLVAAVLAARVIFSAGETRPSTDVLGVSATRQATRVEAGYQATVAATSPAAAGRIPGSPSPTPRGQAGDRLVARSDGQGVVLRASLREDDWDTTGFHGW